MWATFLGEMRLDYGDISPLTQGQRRLSASKGSMLLCYFICNRWNLEQLQEHSSQKEADLLYRSKGDGRHLLLSHPHWMVPAVLSMLSFNLPVDCSPKLILFFSSHFTLDHSFEDCDWRCLSY